MELCSNLIRFAVDLGSIDDVKKALALDEPKLADGTEISITAVKSDKPKAQKRKATDDDDDDSEEEEEDDSGDEGT